MTRYGFIAAEKAAGQQVRKPCDLLGVSRTAYYQWSKQEPSPRRQQDEALQERVVAIHTASRGTYGAPRVHQQLRQDGLRCGRKRVARLMAKAGLCGRPRRRSRRTTFADPAVEPQATDLLQRSFRPDQFSVDQVWVGDISYVRTWEGWCYLAMVIDLASRRVVGLAVAEHMRASLVCDALGMALTARRPGPGLIFHSDRGSQYTSAEFRTLLKGHGLRQSLSQPGQCWDNAVAESFFSTLKTEMVYRQPLVSRAAARRAIFEYIEVFYNRQRIHSALGYRSPVDYEKAMPPTLTATPAA